jgi:hypothetical protein
VAIRGFVSYAATDIALVRRISRSRARRQFEKVRARVERRRRSDRYYFHYFDYLNAPRRAQTRPVRTLGQNKEPRA